MQERKMQPHVCPCVQTVISCIFRWSCTRQSLWRASKHVWAQPQDHWESARLDNCTVQRDTSSGSILQRTIPTSSKAPTMNTSRDVQSLQNGRTDASGHEGRVTPLFESFNMHKCTVAGIVLSKQIVALAQNATQKQMGEQPKITELKRVT